MPEVTQDPDDMEKGDKVGSSIGGLKKTSVCVTPLLSLKTPPTYINKRNYKDYTIYKTLYSRTKDSDVKKNDDSLKRNLEKEKNNTDNDEYIDDPPLQNVNIKSQSHENIRNRLLLKRFKIK